MKCFGGHSSPLTCNSSSSLAFYKVMTGDFSSKLEIPAEVAIRMKFKACEFAVLKGPSGHLWYASFCCSDNYVFLKDGWLNFVSDNGIAAEDILVFRHVIDLYFVVQVFGEASYDKNNISLQNYASSCLREGIISGNCSQKSCEHSKIYTKHFTAPNICDLRPKQNDQIEFDLKAVKKEVVLDGSMATVIASKRGRKRLHKKGNDIFQNQKQPFGCSSTVINILESKEPMFLAVMSKTSVHGNHSRLIIPKKFAEYLLPKEDAEMILVHHKNPGRWQVMFKIYKLYGFFGGWNSFVASNELNIGDKCVFKLISKVPYIFKVFVIK